MRWLLEEGKLAVFVQLPVLTPLIIDALRDHVFISILAYHACGVHICPKLPSPQFFHLWAPFENLARRQTFEQRHYLCD